MAAGGNQVAAPIQDVIPGSIAEDIGLETGDSLYSINGQIIHDILDYQFAVQDVFLEVEVHKPNGETWLIEVEKEEDEELGLILDGAIFDPMKVCRNRCLFCFVDQLPPDLRPTLQIKDDDYRHSFLFGNFITLTNLQQSDWDKILAMRLSPLYISIHAMRPAVRARMLKHKKGLNIREDLERLYRSGIEIHTQIVLCPGINDGEVLEETIEQLAGFYPSVLSIGIVPVGLTKHRQGLPDLKPVTPEQAARLITRVNAYQQRFRREYGLGLVYLADEFYLNAGQTVPGSSYYDSFEQLENGIGLVRLLWDEFAQAEKGLPDAVPPRQTHIVTGVSGTIALQPIVERLNQVAGVAVHLIPVVNSFLGSSITVTGLLTGGDIIKTLGNQYQGKNVLLPEIILKAGEELLLDDISVADIIRASGAEIRVVPIKARDLVDAVLHK
jgi:putative radical SAM enzyme (TIGR03279 family)